jgi:hypothetical protein
MHNNRVLNNQIIMIQFFGKIYLPYESSPGSMFGRTHVLVSSSFKSRKQVLIYKL